MVLSNSTTSHGLRNVDLANPQSLLTSPKLTNSPLRHQSASTKPPFDIITRELKKIGAIPLEDFLSSPSDRPLHVHTTTSAMRRDIQQLSCNTGHDTIAHLSNSLKGENETHPSVPPRSEREANDEFAPTLPLARDNAISRLHQTCVHSFGSVDPLRYEFVEENGQKSKQCILTITNPEGHLRSYRSEAVFLKRADAKARVATLAIQMGALDFILEGKSHYTKSHVQQFVDAVATSSAEQARAIDSTSPEGLIEKCLVEWRAGKVAAEWITYNDSRVVGQYGAALRIQLTNHSFRIYSCDSLYKSEVEARESCAQNALKEGVLDYIKFGNGQTEPAQPTLEDMEPELFDQQRLLPKVKARSMTLQTYYESLPRPFPESFGTKTAVEINAPSYINTLLQNARGGRLKYNFYWMTEKGTNLFGCLLRFERGDTTKTYLADCLFQKRNDAKSAACLLALSQGLGDYIRSIKTSIEANFTPEMRKLASEKFIFALNTECNKIRPGNRLNFTYSDDVDAFGASLEINISSNVDSPDIRKWTVPAEYRSKNDAKLAVCYHAVAQGAIEVLQFKGYPPPHEHVSYWDVIHCRGSGPRVAKRKSVEIEVAVEMRNQPKKRKKGPQKIEPITSTPAKGGRTIAQERSGETPIDSKHRITGKQPLNARSQELNCDSAYDSFHGITGARQLPGDGGARIQSLENLSIPQTPYYPSSSLPLLHYPFSPHMVSPTSTPCPIYYQLSTPSPTTFAPYHPHSIMHEQTIPHPPLYHPAFVPAYPQPPASSYYMMSSPFHSPYAYSPMFLPPTPDGRTIDTRDYRPDMYHQSLPHVPLHPMSPPSTPLRPPRVKRIERETALSPLRMAENLSELGVVEMESGKGTLKITDEGVTSPIEVDDERCLEPGELTEGEEEVPARHQVLERRASIP